MTARTVSRLALLVAVATTLQIAESLIPKPLPWLRLGLANGVALLALIRLGPGAAVTVSAIRVGLGGLLLGALGGPAFLLSVGGTAAALLGMVAAHRFASPPLSPLGLSVIGSGFHVAGQLVVLAQITGVGLEIASLAPVLGLTAVPLGLVTGAVVLAVDRRLVPWRSAW